MSWDGLLAGLAGGDEPPCLRRVDSAHNYKSFRPRGDEHVNGQIWSATLWEVRTLLGREKADRLILESYFQLDGFTDFARGARHSGRRSQPGRRTVRFGVEEDFPPQKDRTRLASAFPTNPRLGSRLE